jgi:hypothetical protein
METIEIIFIIASILGGAFIAYDAMQDRKNKP